MTGQPYIYGAANPITYSDPNGLEPRPIHCRTCGDAGSDPHGQRSDGYGDDGGPLEGAMGWTPAEYLPGMLPDRHRGAYVSSAGYGADVRLAGVPLMQIDLCLSVSNLVTCNKARTIANWVSSDAASSTDLSQYNAFQHMLRSRPVVWWK